MQPVTPMMQQYREIKKQYRDSVLFFRMGDFYEMFEQDAVEASDLLEITLTKRNAIPMCGIPYHAAQTYIAKLLKLGKKIAICEQTHVPGPGKGIATREVVEIVTPGTVIDEGLLDKNSNNYLLALGRYNTSLSLAYIDLSTGEFFTTSFPVHPLEDSMEKLKKELFRLSPKEIIIQESLLEEYEGLHQLLREKEGLVLNRYPDWSFDFDTCRELLEKQLNVKNLKGFGLDYDAPEIISAGAIIDYIKHTSKNILHHIRSLQHYTDSSFTSLDESTQRNLELVQNLRDGSKRYTLLEVLDQCKNSMGKRKLKSWLLHPLLDKAEIDKRLQSVHFFYHNQILLSQLREQLGKVLDLERLSSKVAMERAHAKDLLSIKESLKHIKDIFHALDVFQEMKPFTLPFMDKLPVMTQLIELIDSAIKEEPSILLTEGNIIKEGYNADLDKLQAIQTNAQTVLADLLQEEREKTGISSLKLRYNKIIGYFFDVTKTHLAAVPSYFIRRQSLVGGERFTTEKLSTLETEINSASEKITEKESHLFLEVRAQVKKEIPLLLDCALYISALDVLQSFAFAATIYGYTKPAISEDGELVIVEGRHPVVEANLMSGAFIPNDLQLSKSKSFVLLTGPNMAGKSTYLRQIALISLMAQVGSFVPAQEAVIPLLDKIFCRVGASDNISRGESTFLVEMNETAHILRSATTHSLLIMDEVGRGTSTNDGLSIAWAVCEYILNRIKAKTLFATHYHELTTIKHERLVKLTMDILEKNNEIIFLKKVKKGSTNNSYGIHVAQLAGLPEEVITNAKRILSELLTNMHEHAKHIELTTTSESELPSVSKKKKELLQTSLFSSEEMILNSIHSVDISKTTPLQALNLLSNWQEDLKKKKN
jgi:DNA mismatch repair protein MutS